MKKKVCVIFTGYPMGTNRTSEKLRMSLGLTLNDDNDISLVFLGDSRHSLSPVDESAANMAPITRHLQMISKMKGKLFIENGGDWPLASGLTPSLIGKPELTDMVKNADVLLH
jgi:hypothetical protein